MLNVFSKGRRKSYNCFTIEVRLNNRTLWGYRSTYPYSQRKGVRRPGYLPNLGPLNFRGINSRQFLVRRFLWGNFKAPHKQRFGFCDSYLYPYATTHLRRHFCETLHVLRSDKQTCGHDLKVSAKKVSKYKNEGNLSHIKKLLIACEILA